MRLLLGVGAAMLLAGCGSSAGPAAERPSPVVGYKRRRALCAPALRLLLLTPCGGTGPLAPFLVAGTYYPLGPFLP